MVCPSSTWGWVAGEHSQHQPQRSIRKTPVDLVSRVTASPWGQLLLEWREEHWELENTSSNAWRTRLSSHLQGVASISLFFDKQLGPQDNLILGKLFYSPHQLRNVNTFVKMEVKRLQSISPGMGMAEFIAVGPCDWLLSRWVLFPSTANAFGHFAKYPKILGKQTFW